MPYLLLHGGLFLVISGALWLVLRHYRKKHSLRKSASPLPLSILKVFVAITLIFYISFIPYERSLLKFNTPEAAFAYEHTADEIVARVDLDVCAFMLYEHMSVSSGSPYGISCIERRDSKWIFQGPRNYSISMFSIKHNYFFVYSPNRKSTQALVLFHQGAPKTKKLSIITDSMGQTYQSISTPIRYSDYVNQYYYAVVDIDSADYTVTIDGVAYEIDLNHAG